MIAAIALSCQHTLMTRRRTLFAQFDGLKLEDWTHA